MPDPAQQLQQIYLAGFELKSFDRFPNCIGVVRDNCIALLVAGPDGLRMLGTPGWQIGDALAVLTESGGRKVFQAKQEIIEATAERLEQLSRFRADIERLLAAP
ncbi:MAG TPA: hypothetical protein VEI52_14185 [Terriglobales bacterium]|nr:hypothetical protein [Terriglobales bacterium]